MVVLDTYFSVQLKPKLHNSFFYDSRMYFIIYSIKDTGIVHMQTNKQSKLLEVELVLTHEFSQPEALLSVFFLSILNYGGELLYHPLFYVTKKSKYKKTSTTKVV